LNVMLDQTQEPFEVRVARFRIKGQRGRPTRNLVGMRFGKLLVLEFMGVEPLKNQNTARWLCRCECGNYSIIEAHNLIKGFALSCGHNSGVEKARARFPHLWAQR
jgi:hypothetical protein